MRFEIKDAVPEVNVPKTKSVKIGDVAEGTIEPSIRGDRLSWHACIKFGGANPVPCPGLMQGFGPSPVAAVADAVLQFRRENRMRELALKAAEAVLGSEKFTDEKLLELIKQL